MIIFPLYFDPTRRDMVRSGTQDVHIQPYSWQICKLNEKNILHINTHIIQNICRNLAMGISEQNHLGVVVSGFWIQ